MTDNALPGLITGRRTEHFISDARSPRQRSGNRQMLVQDSYPKKMQPVAHSLAKFINAKLFIDITNSINLLIEEASDRASKPWNRRSIEEIVTHYQNKN